MRRTYKKTTTLLRTTIAIAIGSALLAVVPTELVSAAGYVSISGAGSTWSQNALDQWRRNVNQYGLNVNYAGTGSSDGRNQFRNGTVDFGVSEVPYGLSDNGVVDLPPQRPFAYIPLVAGGTSFMYNLKISGQRITNLRLSPTTLTKIFTGAITSWADPAVAADNPGLILPSRSIVPVVRSDGSGTTYNFTRFMSSTNPTLWDAYCQQAGRPTPCAATSFYPVITGSGFTAQSGSLGVSGYVSQDQNEGTITYVEYSYALNAGFPVVKLLNKSGYYIEPTAPSVAVALLSAQIDSDPASATYLTPNLEPAYNSSDPRAYRMSSYAYMIVPTSTSNNFSVDKGNSLSKFVNYFLCEGQRQAPILGYSPLPINLVQSGLDQAKQVPGAQVANIDITKCNNPTFAADGTNTLANTAPQPQACDQIGSFQCPNGTGGASNTPTPVRGGPVPSEPLNLQASPGPQSLNLGWTVPTSDGGFTIDSYSVMLNPSTGSCDVVGLSAWCTGLIDGVEYSISVTAHNAAGSGPEAVIQATVGSSGGGSSGGGSSGGGSSGGGSSGGGTPAGGTPAGGTPAGSTPTIPTDLKATPGNRKVALTWKAPASNGSSVIDTYAVQMTPADGTCIVSGLAAWCAGLTNGTEYVFGVTAHNASGSGQAAVISATPRTVPTAPRRKNVTYPKIHKALVSWLPPKNNGGSSITGYSYCWVKCTSTASWKSVPKATRFVTIANLAKGKKYLVLVRAKNAAGLGSYLTIRFTQGK